MTAKDQIKQDVNVYCEENHCTVQDFIAKYATTMPIVLTQVLTDTALVPIVAAWQSLQISKGSSQQYANFKNLGEFIYDTNMYHIENEDDNDKMHLHVVKGFEGELELPTGLISTAYMFSNRIVSKQTLGPSFDTSSIVDMSCMFSDSVIKNPQFLCGGNFDTSSVKNMEEMFASSNLIDGFTLGDKFNTSSVTDMFGMFDSCRMGEGFTLGTQFDTSKVVNMSYMFNKATIPDDFTLGDLFNTQAVNDMSYMFNKCNAGFNFSLGEHFDTANVMNFVRMFNYAAFGDKVKLGDKFIVRDNADTECMFRKMYVDDDMVPDDPTEAIKFLQ